MSRWPWPIESIDPCGGGVLATLQYGWSFEPTCHEGVRGFDSSAEALTATYSPCDCTECRKNCAYPFIQSDAGRSASKRPKQKDDCTVRAISIARKLPYDDAYDLLAAAGRKCAKGFDIMTWLAEQPWAIKLSFPAVKGQRRMNPVSFCETHKTGTYIVRVAKHVFTIKDGVVYDTFAPRPDRCIYTSWEIRSNRT